MKALAALVAVTLATVAALDAATVLLDDGSVLVPPPEARVEGFVRALATHRPAQARPYLAPELRARTPAAALARVVRALEARVGALDDVRGVAVARDGGRATAVAVVTTERGPELRLPFPMVRRRGLWCVASLDGLTAATGGPRDGL